MTYDALNRAETVVNMWGKTLLFTYDEVGNRIGVEDSLGGLTTTTYTTLNQPASRLVWADELESRIDFTYKPDGQTATIERFSDLDGTTRVANTSYTYDTAGRLTNIHHREYDGDNIANYTYTYDNHSRITSITRNGAPTTYVYDNTDQLTADGTNTLTYDANGNRTNGSYDTDPGNRLATDGVWNFSYDDEGNLTEKERISDGLTWTYGFDQRNQLVWVEEREDDQDLLQRVEFRYDAHGSRIEKKVDEDGNATWDATQRYALDGWKNVRQPLVGNENWDVWADLDGSSSLTTRYVRGDVIDQLFARIEEDAEGDIPYWYLTDHLGSIRDVIDGSAVVKDSITYDGFGNITAETDSNYRGRYAWTGRELDVEIELQYNRARYYNAATGRWINQDSLGFDAGDSNLYRYIKNSPAHGVDPSGLAVHIREITVTNQGKVNTQDTQFEDLGQLSLGLIIGETSFAYGFKVTIRADVSCGSKIAEGSKIRQDIFAIMLREPKDGDFTKRGFVYHKPRPDGQLVADGGGFNSATTAVKMWTTSKYTFADDSKVNKNVFKNKGAYTHGDDYVEYWDAPGWPGGAAAPAPSPKEHKALSLRIHVKITAQGKDDETPLVAQFWLSRYAKSENNTWVEDPGGQGPRADSTGAWTDGLPQTWNRG
jgi:RHS repeat-associated protein